MTPLTHELVHARLAEVHREADRLRTGRRIAAERRRARRAGRAGTAAR